MARSDLLTDVEDDHAGDGRVDELVHQVALTLNEILSFFESPKGFLRFETKNIIFGFRFDYLMCAIEFSLNWD